MKDFGDALREARLKSGISLEEIHETTRISMKHLLAIESGDFPSVPQTYVRAFIREFAALVGLDKDAAVARYNDFAERERGIPKPPEASDQSHILPKLDDTIEIIDPSLITPRHVEVQGAPEVPEQEDFTPPVRVSPSAADVSTPALDISTTRKNAPASEPQNAGKSPVSEIPAIQGANSATLPYVPPQRRPDPDHSAEDGQSKVASRRSDIIDKLTMQSHAASTPQVEKARQSRRSVYDTKPPIPTEESIKTAVSRQKDAPSSHRNRKREPISQEERRYLIIAAILVGIVIVGIFIIVNFQAADTEQTVAVDSTGIKSTLESGAFIDSSQSMFFEPVLPDPDTMSNRIFPPEDATTRSASADSKEDSLVLEAFSSAPVWFSVKMDTTRTEKGRMSSNDHRIWKARDRFTITLGDGGAVTFFLNGKELGALGDNGVVIRNMPLSRQSMSTGD